MAANRVGIGVAVTGARGAASDLDRLRDKFTNLQKQGAKGLGLGVGAAVATRGLDLLGGAISGVGDFMQTAMGRASDLNESMGKVNVVFGNGAREVEEWADTAAEAFGQSKQQALEAAGTFGNLFQAFGIGQKEAQGMSMRLTELAADLASFNNTSIDDAIIALRSGLSGETEPLKRYGIALSDARMRQALMAQGVKDLGATLTPLQKSQAAYTLILKDSTLAQGDFARTADGVANSIRSNQAAIADLEAEIGQKALPAQKAWLDAQKEALGLASAMAVGLDAGTASIDEQADAASALVGFMAPWASGLVDVEAANVKAAEASKRVTTEVESMRGAVFGAGSTMDRGAKSAEEMAAELDEMEKAARDAEREMDDLADTISEELFGDAINAGNLREMQKTHRELLKQRDAAKEGSAKYVILTGEIAENQQAMFDLQLQMKKKEGPNAVIDWLKEQKRLFGDANGKIQALIDSYRTLDRVQARVGYAGGGGGGGGDTTGRAGGGRRRHSGGPVTAGEPYIVGKPGAEELFVPDTSGSIVPGKMASGGGSGMGGGLTTIPIPVPMHWTPSQQAAWAAEAGPAMVTYLRSRGLV